MDGATRVVLMDLLDQIKNQYESVSGPILRAVRIRELMLCHHIDPPPANLGDDRTELSAWPMPNVMPA